MFFHVTVLFSQFGYPDPIPNIFIRILPDMPDLTKPRFAALLLLLLVH
jgi:hypothetical protein